MSTLVLCAKGHWIRRTRGNLGRVLPRALRIVAGGAALWFCAVVLLIFVYRFIDPIASNLMIMRWLGGAGIEQRWVPVERMSPQLVRAVVASEDARFCGHRGIDFEEIAAAFSRARNGTPRGASTISMQVAKNLFLWPGKSYVRKIIEVPLTLWIEFAWPKWRIFEVYANVAEWGPGIFGAEAAARHHFGKSASRLSEREAALLAATLPNPFARDAGAPGPKTARMSGLVQLRMRAAGQATACVEGRMRSRREG